MAFPNFGSDASGAHADVRYSAQSITGQRQQAAGSYQLVLHVSTQTITPFSAVLRQPSGHRQAQA